MENGFDVREVARGAPDLTLEWICPRGVFWSTFAPLSYIFVPLARGGSGRLSGGSASLRPPSGKARRGPPARLRLAPGAPRSSPPLCYIFVPLARGGSGRQVA